MTTTINLWVAVNKSTTANTWLDAYTFKLTAAGFYAFDISAEMSATSSGYDYMAIALTTASSDDALQMTSCFPKASVTPRLSLFMIYYFAANTSLRIRVLRSVASKCEHIMVRTTKFF